MPEQTHEPGTHEPPRFGEAMESFESGLGIVASGVLTLFAIMGILAVVFWHVTARPPLLQAVGISAAGLVLIAGEVASYWFILWGFQHGRATTFLGVARAQPAYPWAIRPLVAIWWAVHFVVMTIGADVIVQSFHLPDPTPYQRYATLVIHFLILASTGFSANAYLLLAAGALTRRSWLLEMMYHLRFLIDIVVAVALTLLPFDPHRLRFW